MIEEALPTPSDKTVTGADAQDRELPPFERPPGATEAEWQSLELDAVNLTEQSARERLVAAGQSAWPAILNRMTQLNLEDPGDNHIGFLAADVLDRARGSSTGYAFDWRTSQDSSTGELKPKDLAFNVRLVGVMHQTWARVLEDPKHWAKIDRTARSGNR